MEDGDEGVPPMKDAKKSRSSSTSSTLSQALSNSNDETIAADSDAGAAKHGKVTDVQVAQKLNESREQQGVPNDRERNFQGETATGGSTEVVPSGKSGGDNTDSSNIISRNESPQREGIFVPDTQFFLDDPMRETVYDSFEGMTPPPRGATPIDFSTPPREQVDEREFTDVYFSSDEEPPHRGCLQKQSSDDEESDGDSGDSESTRTSRMPRVKQSAIIPSKRNRVPPFKRKPSQDDVDAQHENDSDNQTMHALVNSLQAKDSKKTVVRKELSKRKSSDEIYAMKIIANQKRMSMREKHAADKEGSQEKDAVSSRHNNLVVLNDYDSPVSPNPIMQARKSKAKIEDYIHEPSDDVIIVSNKPNEQNGSSSKKKNKNSTQRSQMCNLSDDSDNFVQVKKTVPPSQQSQKRRMGDNEKGSARLSELYNLSDDSDNFVQVKKTVPPSQQSQKRRVGDNKKNSLHGKYTKMNELTEKAKESPHRENSSSDPRMQTSGVKGTVYARTQARMPGITETPHSRRKTNKIEIGKKRKSALDELSHHMHSKKRTMDSDEEHEEDQEEYEEVHEVEEEQDDCREIQVLEYKEQIEHEDEEDIWYNKRNGSDEEVQEQMEDKGQRRGRSNRNLKDIERDASGGKKKLSAQEVETLNRSISDKASQMTVKQMGLRVIDRHAPSLSHHVELSQIRSQKANLLKELSTNNRSSQATGRQDRKLNLLAEETMVASFDQFKDWPSAVRNVPIKSVLRSPFARNPDEQTIVAIKLAMSHLSMNPNGQVLHGYQKFSETHEQMMHYVLDGTQRLEAMRGLYLDFEKNSKKSKSNKENPYATVNISVPRANTACKDHSMKVALSAEFMKPSAREDTIVRKARKLRILGLVHTLEFTRERLRAAVEKHSLPYSQEHVKIAALPEEIYISIDKFAASGDDPDYNFDRRPFFRAFFRAFDTNKPDALRCLRSLVGRRMKTANAMSELTSIGNSVVSYLTGLEEDPFDESVAKEIETKVNCAHLRPQLPKLVGQKKKLSNKQSVETILQALQSRNFPIIPFFKASQIFGNMSLHEFAINKKLGRTCTLFIVFAIDFSALRSAFSALLKRQYATFVLNVQGYLHDTYDVIPGIEVQVQCAKYKDGDGTVHDQVKCVLMGGRNGRYLSQKDLNERLATMKTTSTLTPTTLRLLMYDCDGEGVPRTEYADNVVHLESKETKCMAVLAAMCVNTYSCNTHITPTDQQTIARLQRRCAERFPIEKTQRKKKNNNDDDDDACDEPNDGDEDDDGYGNYEESDGTTMRNIRIRNDETIERIETPMRQTHAQPRSLADHNNRLASSQRQYAQRYEHQHRKYQDAPARSLPRYDKPYMHERNARRSLPSVVAMDRERDPFVYSDYEY